MSPHGLPPLSALQEVLNNSSQETSHGSPHPAYLHHLSSTVLYNLQFQHDWTNLAITTQSSLTSLPLPRPIVSGLPPKRVYIHPDEQVEILKAEHDTGESIKQHPETEWVLPAYLGEKFSLAKFAEVFDALETVPPSENDQGEEVMTVGQRWRGKNRQKRLLLAILNDDSTVVYYIIHDGIVKPRQN
ncbi:hypothetical protein B7494_g7291 [Chlorociboria aeruginascens]|nr:hypothetical protein B7494_g7291 [Chlorociboria aeruginascens]